MEHWCCSKITLNYLKLLYPNVGGRILISLIHEWLSPFFWLCIPLRQVVDNHTYGDPIYIWVKNHVYSLVIKNS